MVSQGVVAWTCSAIVLISLFVYVVYEIIKRWRVGLRLTALDESLLDDDGVSVVTITDAPPGSQFVPQIPAVQITDENGL